MKLRERESGGSSRLSRSFSIRFQMTLVVDVRKKGSPWGWRNGKLHNLTRNADPVGVGASGNGPRQLRQIAGSLPEEHRESRVCSPAD